MTGLLMIMPEYLRFVRNDDFIFNLNIQNVRFTTKNAIKFRNWFNCSEK